MLKNDGDIAELELSESNDIAKKARPNEEEEDKSIVFGYLALPYVVFSLIDAIWDIVTVALGFPADYNTLEFVTGRKEWPDYIDNSRGSNVSLNFHAFAGAAGLFFVSFQLVSGTFFLGEKPSNDKGTAVKTSPVDPHEDDPKPSLGRTLHRRVGPTAAFAWAVAVTSGFFYLFYSQRLKDKQSDFELDELIVHRTYHCISGTAILVNLSIGIAGAMRGDYPLHRGSMYFSFF